MASKVQICNMALSRLGARSIVSLDEGTNEANLCSTLFDDIAERVMVQGSWTTTIKRVGLALTTDTPSFGYAFSFQLPVDPKCLKVLNVNDTNAATDYRIEGDRLLCNDSSVKIRYIGKLTNTSDYGPLLTEAIELLLASYLAYPLTGNASMADRVKAEYSEVIMNNLAVDNQQGAKDLIISDTLTWVR